MGIPVVICGLYYGTPPQTPSFEYAVKDDVVYFPRLSSGYDFDDEIKLLTAMGATMYGVVSHFIHPDDPVTVEAWADSDWEGILRNFDSYLSFVDKRLPFFGAYYCNQSS